MNSAFPPSVSVEFLDAWSRSDWPTAVELIEQHWLHLTFSPQTYRQFFMVISEAPEEAVLSSTAASLAAEVIGRFPVGRTSFSLPRGEERINQAIRSGQARSLLEVSTHALIGRRVGGAYAEGALLMEATRPLLAACLTTRFSPAADLAAYWHLQAGQIALQAGDFAGSQADLDRAWHYRRADITGYAAPTAGPLLALLAVLDESASESSRWHDSHAEHMAGIGETLIEADTMARPLLVSSLLMTDPATDPAVSLAEALEVDLAFDEWMPISLFALVRHLCNRGETDRARRLIDTTLDRAGSIPIPAARRGEHAHPTMQTVMESATRATLHLAEGQPARARRALASDRGRWNPAMLQRLDSQITAALEQAQAQTVPLTAAETRVLAMLGAPGPLPQIAARLHISVNTLKTHLRSLYDKLGVGSRAEAVHRARELHLID